MSGIIEALNAQFSIGDQLRVVAGCNGMPMVRVRNSLASADIYLQGAHITSFCPAGHDEVLWMSPEAQFQPGKAIRGGVPVIWPWFGPHATDNSKPQHGFVRTADWQVCATDTLADGSTQLQLHLIDNVSTRALWPYAFELSLTITVGTQLTIDLRSRNTDNKAFVMGGALHSYFAIADIAQLFIDGLAGGEYIDQLDGNRIKPQHGEVRINQEVDRIYVNTTAACVIHDTQASRQTHVSKMGSHSTVVWNPWIDKARVMADFFDEGYRTMVCIETANAADDVVELAPGEEHTLSQMIVCSKD